ncbi:myb-related transcription factor, partner of profilin-like [Ambystoma mexicanum]|uniref:myb-related transcription factor, partner of profilin-like n=1 Tax=Ambystoma mexicanum TaxID=8296 RepID=UPI0037E84BB9
MPKAIKKGAFRQCKVHFSEDELNMLADTLTQNADVVFAADLSQPAQIKKKEIWEEVARRVSAVSSTDRTVKHVKKQWDNLRLRVKNILSANQSEGLATGGGAHSPIKLTRWEETCASTISMEGIEGVGDMERVVPSSADGGTDAGSDGEDAAAQARTPTKKARARDDDTRPSTSKATSKQQMPPKPKPIQHAKAQGRQTTAATPLEGTQEVSTDPEAVADRTLSAANSSIGKAAASAPQSGDEGQCQVEQCIPEDDNLSRDGACTLSAQQTSQHTPLSTPDSNPLHQSGGEAIPDAWSPPEDRPALGPSAVVLPPPQPSRTERGAWPEWRGGSRSSQSSSNNMFPMVA